MYRYLRVVSIPMAFKSNSIYYIMPILLIILGITGIYYFILFIHSNSIAFQITSFALAAIGALFLYNGVKRRKETDLSKKG